MTVNYEMTPEEEVQLLESMGFALDEMIPMTEKVGFFGYTPDISTYYVSAALAQKDILRGGDK